MEEMGFAEPAQDLWDSRRTLPIFGTTRTSLLTRYGMKPWDSQLHANSKYFFQSCKPTKTLNAVVRTDLPLSWKREGFVFNLRRYGMPVLFFHSCLISFRQATAPSASTQRRFASGLESPCSGLRP